MTKKKTALVAICFVIFTLLLSSCSSSDLINSYRYKISDKELALSIGEGHALTVVGSGAEDTAKLNVEWSSSDSKIASVDEVGFVVANSEGTATVTAKVSDGDIEVEYNCKVKVSKNGVSLLKFGYASSEIEIVKGQTFSPRVTVYPGNADNKNYTVTSSDESVVSVSADGKITGVSEGKAVITAKTDDGSFSSSATVIVSAEKNLVESVVLDNEKLSLTVGETEQLTATVTPSNLGLEMTWTSSNPAVASVSSKGVVTAKSDGKTLITVTVHDILSDKTASCEVTVYDKDSEIRATGLTFETDTITLVNGDTSVHNFKATVTPSNTTNVVSWSSSDSSLLYVNARTGDFQLRGTVTETTKVTVTCRVGAISKRGTVIITPAEEKLPTVTVTPIMKSSFAVDEKSSLTLSFSPDISAAERKQITVSFDDSFTEFFKVSLNDVGDYTLTAVKEGSGTLRFTVSSSSGRYEYVTETVSFNIGSVSDGELEITAESEITLEQGETNSKWFTLKKDGETVSVSDAGVTFSSSDSSVAAVTSSGKIEAKGEGSATVTVTDGKTSKSVRVTVTPEVFYSMNVSSSTISATSSAVFTVTVENGDINDVTVILSDDSVYTFTKDVSGKSATVTVFVKEGQTPVENVTVTLKTYIKGKDNPIVDQRTLTVE